MIAHARSDVCCLCYHGHESSFVVILFVFDKKTDVLSYCIGKTQTELGYQAIVRVRLNSSLESLERFLNSPIH